MSAARPGRRGVGIRQAAPARVSRSRLTSASRTREIAEDRGDCKCASRALHAHQAVLASDIAFDNEVVPFLGVADIGDRNVVMLAPEERDRMERLAASEHVDGGQCPCRSATTQCSTRMASPVSRSGQRAMSPAAKIPGALVSRNASTTSPRSILRPAASARPSRGRTPTPGDDEIGLQDASAVERHPLALEAARRFAPVENDAMLLVERLHEAAELEPQDLLHRPLFRRDDMDFDIARAQRRRNFKADEAGAEHDRRAAPSSLFR